MSDEQRPQPELWPRLRSHPAFQAAVVFAGASWLALQAADVFGLATETVRVLGVLLVTVFVLLVGISLFAVLRHDHAKIAVGRVRTRTVALTAAGLFVLGTAAWFARPYLVPPLRPGADVIAVLPFSAVGSGVDVLGEGLVDLLSTNLNEVGLIRTINPRTTLHEFNDVAPDGSIDLPGQLRVGRNVGAGSVLVGSVVSTGSEVRINAELYSVETGAVIARAQESGRPDSVLALVDQLSVQLMQDIWRSRAPMPELRVSAITSASIPAIKAYLRGEQFYRGVQWDSAAAAFEEAVTHDSTFALAHFRLGETHGWRESLGSSRAMLHSDAAARFAERLPARERTLIVAHQLHEQGNVAALDSLQSYVARFPDDVGGYYLLADARFHAGVLLGLDHAAMLAGFERVHSMDSTFAPNYAHLLELSSLLGDSARYRRYLSLYEDLAPGEAAVYAAMHGVRWSDPDTALAALGAILREPIRRGASINRIMQSTALRDSMDIDFVMAIIDTVKATGTGTQQEQNQIAAFRVAALAGTGRFREADQAAAPLRAQHPQLSLSFTIPFVIGGVSDTTTFRAERDALRSAGGRSIGAYWLVIEALIAGDVPTADRYMKVLRTDTTNLEYLRPQMISALEGWMTIARGDTLGGLDRMKDALLELGYAPAAMGPSGPLRIGLALLQTTQPATRDEGIRRLEVLLRHDPASAIFFTVPLAEAYLAAGRPQDAARMYQRLIARWSDADPGIQPRVQSARAALARITGERVAG